MYETKEERPRNDAIRQPGLLARALEGKAREELLELARTYHWWHAIDLGGFVTTGKRSTLIDRGFDQIDFKGKKVLDVGCWDGLWSFEAEKRGAKEVYSIDYVSLRSWSEQPTYQLAHRILGSRASYYPNLSVYDIKKLGVTDFDVVIYCGIYYHLLDPLRAFAALRDVMVEGGFILVEGPVLDGSDRVLADFYCRNWFGEDPTNWWVPTISCLREWLDCTFFDVISEVCWGRDLSQPRHASESNAAAIAIRRLRKLFGRGGVRAAMRKLQKRFGFGRERVATGVSNSQDRCILVARATSVSERLAHQVDGKGLAPLLTTSGMTPKAIAGFCEAAARFYRAQPWQGIRQDVTIKIECASLGAQPAFVMVLGNGSLQRGMAIYFDRGWLTMTLQGSLPGDRIAWAPFLAVFYRGEAELPAGEASTLSDWGWTGSKERYPFAVFNEAYGEKTRELGNRIRRPNPLELQVLEACLRVLPAFIENRSTTEPGGEVVNVPVAGGQLGMTLSWITEGAREL
jgi:tRNA (mo5U34)-methyltransferase